MVVNPNFRKLQDEAHRFNSKHHGVEVYINERSMDDSTAVAKINISGRGSETVYETIIRVNWIKEAIKLAQNINSKGIKIFIK